MTHTGGIIIYDVCFFSFPHTYQKDRICHMCKKADIKIDLITEYFINNSKAAGNIVRWKMHFRKCCRLPYHQDGDILENFCFLEQTGQLSVGKYDILENIFYHVDKRALLNIKDASSKIDLKKNVH